MGLPKVSQHTARRDIYKIGLKTPNHSKQGFKHTRYLPADENDKVLIPKGSKYFSWNRKGQPTCYSLTYPIFPKLSSEYNDKMDEFNSLKDSLSSEEKKEELLANIEDYKDELQSRLDNIPDQLQESSILNERIDELEYLHSEIEELEIEED